MANKHIHMFFQLPFAAHAAPKGEGIDQGNIATALSNTPR